MDLEHFLRKLWLIRQFYSKKQVHFGKNIANYFDLVRGWIAVGLRLKQAKHHRNRNPYRYSRSIAANFRFVFPNSSSAIFDFMLKHAQNCYCNNSYQYNHPFIDGLTICFSLCGFNSPLHNCGDITTLLPSALISKQKK
jgi:hypothetical protein